MLGTKIVAKFVTKKSTVEFILGCLTLIQPSFQKTKKKKKTEIFFSISKQVNGVCVMGSESSMVSFFPPFFFLLVFR